jgi:hypothetical protein
MTFLAGRSSASSRGALQPDDVLQTPHSRPLDWKSFLFWDAPVGEALEMEGESVGGRGGRGKGSGQGCWGDAYRTRRGLDDDVSTHSGRSEPWPIHGVRRCARICMLGEVWARPASEAAGERAFQQSGKGRRPVSRGMSMHPPRMSLPNCSALPQRRLLERCSILLLLRISDCLPARLCCSRAPTLDPDRARPASFIASPSNSPGPSAPRPRHLRAPIHRHERSALQNSACKRLRMSDVPSEAKSPEKLTVPIVQRVGFALLLCYYRWGYMPAPKRRVGHGLYKSSAMYNTSY